MAATLARSIDLAKALDPFSPTELARLRRHASKANELRESRFVHDPQEFRPSTDENGIVTYEIRNASREVVSAVMAPLRLLYSQRDNVSFARVRSMIGRHASSRDTADAQLLLERLRSYKTRAQAVMAVDPDMGQYYVDESGAITTIHKPSMREIFEDWLYGEYLHDDEDRLARIDMWRSIGVHECLFLETVRELIVLFVDFADDIVAAILDEPALAGR